MRKAMRITLQIVAYAAMAVLLGYFATMPPYRYAAAGMASIKLSLSHAADRVKPCVPLTQEEIAALAANMRRAESCERERLPLVLEMDVDGEAVARIVAAPSGVWNDGPASVYERFDIVPGRHVISVRIRDTARESGWDYSRTDDVDLVAGRYFTVTFKAENGGFQFR